MPQRAVSFRIVVLSPPGMINPCTSARSSGRRTLTASTPMDSSSAMCSMKAPWSARTPIFTFGPRASADVPALPAPDCQALGFGDARRGDAAHRSAETLRNLGDDLRIVVVERGLDDRLGRLGRVLALEDAAPHEDALGAELHRERRVRRNGDAAGDEVHDRQLALVVDLLHEVVRGVELLGGDEQLVLAHRLEPANVRHERSNVADRLDDVAGAGLALRSDHGRAFVDPAE